MPGWATDASDVGQQVRAAAQPVRRKRDRQRGRQAADDLLLPDDEAHPEHEAVVSDYLGVAPQCVPNALTPAERVAFVLHDRLDVPFDEIAPRTIVAKITGDRG
jgi:DNA-directed RNA polymerase specialized sigma24 family protein